MATRVESVQSPHDPSVPTRLKALVDLQAIVRAGSLPPDQLVLVKKQVDELSAKMRGPAQQQQHQPVSLAANVAHPAPHISHPPPSSSATPTPAPGQGGLTVDSLLGKGALAALLAQQQAAPSRNTTPTPAVPTPTPPPAPAAAPAPPPASDPMSLIQQLRQRGIIGAAAPPPPPPAPAPNTIESALAALPPVIMKALTPMKATPPADPREISWDLTSLQVP